MATLAGTAHDRTSASAGTSASAAPDDFLVKFWGVRGSIACSSLDTIRYGGNTSSLEIRCGDRLLMFDCGTGARYLGRQLCREAPVDADIFLSHTHFDHICGLPFFVPFFDPRNRFRIHAGHLGPDMTLRHVLAEMMMAPLFPVPLEIFGADISFENFRCGETLHPGPGIVLRTAALNHPNGATGYRVEYGGRSICYLTDTEHKLGEPDQTILALIDGADIVVYDCMYTDEEYAQRVGWGHSTWQEGARLCEMAGVKTFVVFHHDPDHDDAFLDRVGEELDRLHPGWLVAREGLVLRP